MSNNNISNNEETTISPSSSQLRLSIARFLNAPDIALTTRSLPWPSSSATIGRPFSRRTVALMYRPYWKKQHRHSKAQTSVYAAKRMEMQMIQIHIRSKIWYLHSIGQRTGSEWHRQQPQELKGSWSLWAMMCKYGPPLAGTTAHNLMSNRKTQVLESICKWNSFLQVFWEF